ncbi:MAG: HEAT repeat domain-containing protein [Chloroflexota bacterium]
MKQQEREKSFSSVLDELFNDEQVSIPLLYRLSDLADEPFGEFAQRWPAVADERRRVIARHLVDICEENYVVDFSRVFIFCFGDASPAVRVAALDGIWDESNMRLVSPVIELMQTDPSVEVRAAAAAALSHYVLMAEWGQIPRTVSPRIVAALLAEYDRAETAVSVKRAALEALGAANHPRVVEMIEDAYEGDDFDMTLSAVFAMGSSADERWLPIVLREMSNPSPEMRVEAVRAAGSIGNTEALPILARLAADEDFEVAYAVVEALGQMGGELAHKMLTRMAEDDDFARLHDAVDEALEEMDWLGGEFDLMDMMSDDTDDIEDDDWVVEE